MMSKKSSNLKKAGKKIKKMEDNVSLVKRITGQDVDSESADMLIAIGNSLYERLLSDESIVDELCESAFSGNIESLKSILEKEKEVDINTKNAIGKTALFYAVSSGRENVLRFLIENGAKTKVKDDEGKTPLHIAAGSGKSEIVRVLLENGAKVDYLDPEGSTSLHLACSSGDFESVELIVNEGADLSLQDANGDTALHIAAGSGKKDIVNLLIGKGADLSIKNQDGNTPLSLCEEILQETLDVKSLLEKEKILHSSEVTVFNEFSEAKLLTMMEELKTIKNDVQSLLRNAQYPQSSTQLSILPLMIPEEIIQYDRFVENNYHFEPTEINHSCYWHNPLVLFVVGALVAIKRMNIKFFNIKFSDD